MPERHLKVRCASKPFTTQTRVPKLLSDALIRRLRHHKSAEGGGFAWADMAVLVRTNKQGALLAQHMLNEGITPQTEDSLHVEDTLRLWRSLH